MTVMKDPLTGSCGFYCPACPTFAAGGCAGCHAEHQPGDCFTRDCTRSRGLDFCGHCPDFPCETILTRPKTTLLDPAWMAWKRRSDTNRQAGVDRKRGI